MKSRWSCLDRLFRGSVAGTMPAWLLCPVLPHSSISALSSDTSTPLDSPGWLLRQCGNLSSQLHHSLHFTGYVSYLVSTKDLKTSAQCVRCSRELLLPLLPWLVLYGTSLDFMETRRSLDSYWANESGSYFPLQLNGNSLLLLFHFKWQFSCCNKGV